MELWDLLPLLQMAYGARLHRVLLAEAYQTSIIGSVHRMRLLPKLLLLFKVMDTNLEKNEHGKSSIPIWTSKVPCWRSVRTRSKESNQLPDLSPLANRRALRIL